MSVVDQAALAVIAAGIAVAVAAGLVGRWRDGLASALDLWLAAGLLRLGSDPSVDRIASTAAIIAVRRLIGTGMGPSRLNT